MHFPVFIVLFVVNCFIKVCLQQKLEEKCKLHDGTSGYCAYAENCLTRSIYSSNTIHHNLCESSDLKEVVCCPFANVKRLKSVDKCLDYSKFNENKRYPRNIAGGYKALPGEFSHVAALGYSIHNKIKWNCAGILISEQYVLTAAHCLNTRIGKVKFVRLGDLDLDSDEDMAKPQTYKVKDLIAYPQFQRKRKLNDIGLIKLNQTVQFDVHVFPACLYVNKKIAYDSLTAVGWSSSHQLNSDRSKSLMKVNLDVFSTLKCRKFYKFKHDYNIFSDRQFCAVGTQTVKDTCQGASGSPLLAPTYFNGKTHYAVGIVSFGPKCGRINNPGVYTKIDYYISWIESVVWP